MPTVARHRAAIHRKELSRPLRLAIADGLLGPETRVFDYGCGHGDDLRLLAERGIAAVGWDPAFRPSDPLRKSDVVNLGYVLNVIENPAERIETVRAAWALATRVLVVSARTTLDAPLFPNDRLEDGIYTRRGTFQKFYDQQELRAWIDTSLAAQSVPAAPGVFYIFRDEQAREAFAATRYRRAAATVRASADELFQQHKEALEPIVEFLNARGRLPAPEELDDMEAIVAAVGTFRRGCAIVRRAIGEPSWMAMEMLRSEDLLVYLALSRFQTRPRFGSLPRVLQLDVRSFFRSYDRACALADEILMSAGDAALIAKACRASTVGKLTPSALYVHMDALQDVPPLLRVYEGCAKSVTGIVEGANLVKLHHDSPMVSYLTYPAFETDPHPALAASVVVHLQVGKLDARDFRASSNPPILHRKELFLPSTSPLRAKFARLTAQEERAGLYERSDVIGTRDGWTNVLAERGMRLVGHRVVRA